MQSQMVSFGGQKKNIISCHNHGSTRVKYRVITSGKYAGGDQWVFWFDNYRLMFLEPTNKTYFQLCHPEAESPAQYYENIRIFDGEVNITPEQFPDKIKTLLTWS
jgi:hypothetical protein